jgi:outer membrane protein OmpA-like peptidoglycan-associated protein
MALSCFNVFGVVKPVATLALSGFIWCAHDQPASAKDADRTFVESVQEGARRLTPLSPEEREHVAALKRPETSVEVYFDSDSATITPQAESQLNEIGKALSDPQFEYTVFVLVSHTDAIGGDEHKQKLSERRAATVKSYLTSKFKISAHLVSVGVGKRYLKDPAHPHAPENNRIEILNLGTFKPEPNRLLRLL